MYPVFVGQTAFPTRPDATLSFQPRAFADALQPSFRLLDGPPYANGPAHLGHIMGKHLKDAVVKAAMANGEAVLWQPGWDCHGLPIELQVERNGAAASDPVEFISSCRRYATNEVERQARSFCSQGLVADWRRPYRTMDFAIESMTLRTFARLFERGHIEVRNTPTWWCPQCASTLAQAEQEEVKQTVEAIVVPFPALDGSVFLVWTTTPWTLPYHEALVAHPDALYGCWMIDGRKAWCAMDAWPQVARWYGCAEDQPPVEQLQGTRLGGRTYTTPWGRTGAVRTDARVQAAGGTGFLHVVPAFGMDDAALGAQWNLPVATCLDEHAVFDATAWEPHRFRTTADAASLVVEQARQWALVRTMPWEQTVPACWRHKSPLVVRPSRQIYFTLSESVRLQAQQALETVRFTPETARHRLLDAMSHRPDWCLSRQRRWGVPVGLFVHRQNGTLHPDSVAILHRVADAISEHGVEIWWRQPDPFWIGADAEDYQRIPDVLDVWFDSGCVFLSTGPDSTPEVVLEGHDQFRGWFQSSVWVAAGLGLPAPFRRVIVHGFVVGHDGKKLSKSSGGDKKQADVPDWQSVSSDVVRVWALQSAVQSDKKWSKADIQTARDRVIKWRNTMRFILANTAPSHLDGDIDPGRWRMADRWAVSTTQAICQQILDWCQEGLFEKAVAALQRLAVDTLSRDFFPMLKDRLYCDTEHGPERRMAQQALAAVGGHFFTALSVLAPRLWAEGEHYSGEWKRIPIDIAPDARWQACLALKHQAAALWSDESTQGGGGLLSAGVTLRSFEGIDAEDWLIWLGCSEVAETGAQPLEVYRLPGRTCPRCRWVTRAPLADDHVCARCERRLARIERARLDATLTAP